MSAIKYKNKIKERIKLSNDRVKQGFDPDPWVVEYRRKNNETKARWKAKQPKKTHVYKANSGSFKKGQTPHNKKTPEQLQESKKRWAENTKRWHKENRELINKQRKNRRVNDISFKLKCNMRKRLSFLLKKSITEKTTQTMKLLGCDMKFFMEYLESRFQEGMTFQNYGEWHIDHIMPCDSFDFTIIEDQKKCFHYTNLQPLWAKENRVKSNKVLEKFQVV